MGMTDFFGCGLRITMCRSATKVSLLALENAARFLERGGFRTWRGPLFAAEFPGVAIEISHQLTKKHDEWRLSRTQSRTHRSRASKSEEGAEMEQSYWRAVSTQRITRRRALAATAGAAVGAGLLAACGGGSTKSGSGGNKSGLVTQPVDTFKQAKRGGTLRDANTQEPPSLDFGTPLRGHPGAKVVEALLRDEPGVLKPPGGEIAPSIAESWEWSPDRLQVTLKLRPGVKFHNKPPVNGRALDIDDVLFSWKRFGANSPNRGSVDNAFNPGAPVLSLSAADPRTIVIKLKEPVAYALELFVGTYGHINGNVAMLPKEADSTLDLRKDMIGTGPFVMANYASSVGFTFKRNPEYFDKDFALVDQIDYPLVSEYATRIAQFKAGNIHYLADVRGEDLLSVKREEPRLLIYPSIIQLPVTQATDHITFGMLPDGKSPFLDERVRQAVSMSWDRDLWIETFHNIAKFEAEGLPLEARWNSHIWAGWDGWWLDPKGKDFGANAKYFRHDLAEAKKLLAAGGYPNGFDTTSHYPISGTGSAVARLADVSDGMAREIGVRTKTENTDYATVYIPQYRDGQGQYEGWSYHSMSGASINSLSPVRSLAAMFWSKSGTTFSGFSTSGKNDLAGDPQLDGLIEKARLEPDNDRRLALVFDIQRYLGKSMWGLLQAGGATGFTMAWPALSNYGVYQATAGWGHYRWWLDDTKAPFKSG
jgi:peptide/nickel transport system substrate-binding protein